MSTPKGDFIAVQPIVPGFTITGELDSRATWSTRSAMRSHDDHAVVVTIVRVPDAIEAQARAADLVAVLHRIENEHLVRAHGAIALADGTLALVRDRVNGASLAEALGARGLLTPGETVTTIAPLFGALADLHAAGVVHGALSPREVKFGADGRPLISGLGVSGLLEWMAGPGDGTSGFVAPEVLGGAAHSRASDVYAMAAIGWFCLTGDQGVSGKGLLTAEEATGEQGVTGEQTLVGEWDEGWPSAAVRPQAPPRLVAVLTSCLATDPAKRPSARAAALKVFDAATPESVCLGSVSDPAAEITRRIRAAAVCAPIRVEPSIWRRHRPALAGGVVALLVVAALGGGATWYLRVRSVALQPVAVRSLANPLRTSPPPTAPTGSKAAVSPAASSSKATAATVSPAATLQRNTDVVAASDAARADATGLLQALVDARALAYVARRSTLLDLVYAPGATKAAADRSNIATAITNGATYVGLTFVIKDASFLDRTSSTARIRAAIVTPAYETGQPDGRKIAHPQEIVGPSVFTVQLTSDGWRILSLTGP